MSTTIVSAAALAQKLETWRVLDCRAALGDREHGRGVFAEAHIPGAVHADLDDDLAAPPGEGGRHPLPDPELLARKFRDWGASDAGQIVAYDDSGGAFAARAWWLARWLGHERVAVLDGGLAAWTGQLSREVRAPVRGDFSRRAALTRSIDAEGILRSLPEQGLVDARAKARFDGREEPIDPIAGHIPGAVCRPFQENLDEAGRFRPAEDLRERFAAIGADPVCYCGSGVTAAHNVLAMRLAGLPEPILYPGSWSDWIRDPARPVSREDR